MLVKTQIKYAAQTYILVVDLKALVDEIIPKPFDHNVALPWSHWLIIYTYDQCLASLLNRHHTSSLHVYHSKARIYQTNQQSFPILQEDIE